MEITNINIWAASIYLAVTVSQEELQREGLLHLTPKIVTHLGRKPSVATKELSGAVPRSKRRNPDDIPEENDPDVDIKIGRRLDEEVDDDESGKDSKWTIFHREYTAQEKKRMVAKVLEVAIKTT